MPRLCHGGGMPWTARLTLLACAVTMLAGCGDGDATTPEDVVAQVGDCPQVQVVGVRGKSQSLDRHRGLGTELDGIVTRLESTLAERGTDRVDVDAIHHRSRATDERTDYDADVAAGSHLLLEKLGDVAEDCPDVELVVAGFSQGAQVAQETLAAHPRLAEHVTVLALVGSPRHDPSAPVDHLDLPGDAATRPGSLGAGPSLGPLAARTVVACRSDDDVCDTPAGGVEGLAGHKHGYTTDTVRDEVADAVAARLS